MFTDYLDKMHRPGNKVVFVHGIELPEMSIQNASMLTLSFCFCKTFCFYITFAAFINTDLSLLLAVYSFDAGSATWILCHSV